MKPKHLPLRRFDRAVPWHRRLSPDETAASRDKATRCCLYRFYDANRRLLYVGITRSPLTRWDWHSTRAAWWPLAEYVAFSVYGSREDCALAEGAAMYHERPLFNIQYPRPRKGRRSPENPRYAPPVPEVSEGV